MTQSCSLEKLRRDLEIRIRRESFEGAAEFCIGDITSQGERKRELSAPSDALRAVDGDHVDAAFDRLVPDLPVDGIELQFQTEPTGMLQDGAGEFA